MIFIPDILISILFVFLFVIATPVRIQLLGLNISLLMG